MSREQDAILVKNTHRKELLETPGVFGLMVKRDDDGAWFVKVLVDPSVPLPPDRVVDGVCIRHVHEMPPQRLT